MSSPPLQKSKRLLDAVVLPLSMRSLNKTLSLAKNHKIIVRYVVVNSRTTADKGGDGPLLSF